MLLTWLVSIMSVIGLASGLTVLALGDWSKLQLKYAGVAISTASSFWIIVMAIQHGNMWSYTDDLGEERLFYMLIMNTALIIFHISTGYDAMTLKKFDRRRYCEPNPTNNKKRSAA